MFATGETVGLAEWLIDDTCLVIIIFLIKMIVFPATDCKNSILSPNRIEEKFGPFIYDEAGVI